MEPVNPQPTEQELTKRTSSNSESEKSSSVFNQNLSSLQKKSTICSQCGKGTVWEGEGAFCFDCRKENQKNEEIKRGSERLLSNLDGWVDKQLEGLGLAPREIKAKIELIPSALKKSLPKDKVKEFTSGGGPCLKGWGMGGNTGCGKTMAMAAMLKAHVKAVAQDQAPKLGYFTLDPTIRVWSSWPDEVNWIRANALDPRVHERIKTLQDCALLLLDDLGRERIKGSYADDWAASQLDGILNSRYRYEQPTIWTTNLTLQQLADIYGGAMLSRLTADNPLVWIDNLPDLRG